MSETTDATPTQHTAPVQLSTTETWQALAGQTEDTTTHPVEVVATAISIATSPSSTPQTQLTITSNLLPDRPLPTVPVALHNKRKIRLLEEVTEEALITFFEHVQTTGQLNRAAEKAGICMSTINRLRRTDSEFDEMVKEYHGLFCDRMEGRAYKLAFDGWDEDVIGKDGSIITTKWMHDSRLAELLLKRNIREFNPNVQVDVAVSGGVLIAPVGQKTIEDWQAAHGAIVPTGSMSAGPVIEGEVVSSKTEAKIPEKKA